MKSPISGHYPEGGTHPNVDVAFRVICAQDAPEHSTVSRFRAAHEEAFIKLFTQVLVLAAQAGLGRFGTVAVDGFKAGCGCLD